MSSNTDFSKTGIRLEVIEEIKRFAEIYGMEKVILFGSRARGDWKRESDIDLAVKGGDADAFRLALEEETSTLLCYDVVSIDNDIKQYLMFAIETEGMVLYEKI